MLARGPILQLMRSTSRSSISQSFVKKKKVCANGSELHVGLACPSPVFQGLVEAIPKPRTQPSQGLPRPKLERPLHTKCSLKVHGKIYVKLAPRIANLPNRQESDGIELHLQLPFNVQVKPTLQKMKGPRR